MAIFYPILAAFLLALLSSCSRDGISEYSSAVHSNEILGAENLDLEPRLRRLSDTASRLLKDAISEEALKNNSHPEVARFQIIVKKDDVSPARTLELFDFFIDRNVLSKERIDFDPAQFKEWFQAAILAHVKETGLTQKPLVIIAELLFANKKIRKALISETGNQSEIRAFLNPEAMVDLEISHALYSKKTQKAENVDHPWIPQQVLSLGLGRTLSLSDYFAQLLLPNLIHEFKFIYFKSKIQKLQLYLLIPREGQPQKLSMSLVEKVSGELSLEDFRQAVSKALDEQLAPRLGDKFESFDLALGLSDEKGHEEFLQFLGNRKKEGGKNIYSFLFQGYAINRLKNILSERENFEFSFFYDAFKNKGDAKLYDSREGNRQAWSMSRQARIRVLSECIVGQIAAMSEEMAASPLSYPPEKLRVEVAKDLQALDHFSQEIPSSGLDNKLDFKSIIEAKLSPIIAKISEEEISNKSVSTVASMELKFGPVSRHMGCRVGKKSWDASLQLLAKKDKAKQQPLFVQRYSLRLFPWFDDHQRKFGSVATEPSEEEIIIHLKLKKWSRASRIEVCADRSAYQVEQAIKEDASLSGSLEIMSDVMGGHTANGQQLSFNYPLRGNFNKDDFEDYLSLRLNKSLKTSNSLLTITTSIRRGEIVKPVGICQVGAHEDADYQRYFEGYR